MKKFSLSLLVALFLSSCHITQNVDYPNSFTQTYRIYAKDMIQRTDVAGIYFEYEFREPKLSLEIIRNGIMQAFLYYKKDGRDTYCPLPFSDFVVSGNVQWEEYFTVEFQPGIIKFIQKISDQSSDPPVSESYDILVRFLW